MHRRHGRLARHVSASELPAATSLYTLVRAWLTEADEEAAASGGGGGGDALALLFEATRQEASARREMMVPVAPPPAAPPAAPPPAAPPPTASAGAGAELPFGWGDRRSTLKPAQPSEPLVESCLLPGGCR